MKNVLNKIHSSVLTQIIGKTNLRKITDLLMHEKKNPDLADLALAFFGTNILDNSKIRIEAIKTLSEKTVQELSVKYCGKIFPSIGAAAMQLSGRAWSAQSSFALELVDKLGISREYLPAIQTKLNTSEIIEPVGQYYQLFEYQRQVKVKIVEQLLANQSRFIVQMPTGSGKTKTAMEALLAFNKQKELLNSGLSYLWVAHTEELCEQAIETVTKIWRQTQQGELRIIRYYGGHNPGVEELHGSFIFSSYQKLCSKNSDAFVEIMSNSCKVIVIDEAHKALARTYRAMLEKITENGSTLVGLTATPGRTSKEILPNSEFSLMFNRKIIMPEFDTNPILALRAMGILSTLDLIVLESNQNLLSPLSSSNEEEPDYSQEQLRSLWMNSERNLLILETIKQEVANKNPCLVFTCSVEHNVILSSALNYHGIPAKFVDSGQKKSQRREIISDFKSGEFDVLLNYGVLTTGFDAPRIKTVIITRPTTSIVLYSQMIGRGLRGKRVGGNDTCRIIDIRDNLEDFGPIEDIYDFFDGYWEGK